MRTMLKMVLVFALVSAFALAVSAQESRRALSKPSPRYPEIARKMNLAGSVKVEVVIGSDGKVKEANVVGGHPILVDATLVALKEWKYEPAKTETSITLTFDFRP